MSDTPICDFITKYIKKDCVRAHMPGHKGKVDLGFECRDITEIEGADQLFAPNGIIAESEKNASGVFSCPTYYSTEGSSLCIRAMLYMALIQCKNQSKTIIAARNVHKTFVSASALLGINVKWLYSQSSASYLSAKITAQDVENTLSSETEKPIAVYITTPDYLGEMSDVRSIANVCKKHNVPLIVDNAHGAYLNFLPTSLHPISLGADMCCDSAHKTLPVLTGGAYLHINSDDRFNFTKHAKNAMSIFASTSPSYLILESLDKANVYLKDHKNRTEQFLPCVSELKSALKAHGYTITGNEPTKITLSTKPFGYTGNEIAEILYKKGIVCEFHDKDYLVMMLTCENTKSELEKIKSSLLSIPMLPPIAEKPPLLPAPTRIMNMRDAMLAPCETLPIEKCIGRVMSSVTVSCPPAVPILVCGELITKEAADCFLYYDIKECSVVASSV